MLIPMTVTYRDGTEAEVVADQYALGVYARWAVKSGLPVVDPSKTTNPAELVTPVRVWAWAELQRDAKVKVPFDTWDATVVSVEAGAGAKMADPTRPAASAG